MEKLLLDAILKETLEGETVTKLTAVYEELDSTQKSFLESFPSVHCPSGCMGHCCLHYVPYLTEAEAETAAYEAILEDKADEILKQLEEADPNGGGCPLYREEGEYHCSFYQGRSMVCRLFGTAVTEDKQGRPAYKVCKWKDHKETLDASSLEEKRDILPIMSRFGEKMMECGEGNADGESIYTALPKAIGKLQMILRYSSLSEENS